MLFESITILNILYKYCYETKNYDSSERYIVIKILALQKFYKSDAIIKIDKIGKSDGLIPH